MCEECQEKWLPEVYAARQTAHDKLEGETAEATAFIEAELDKAKLLPEQKEAGEADHKKEPEHAEQQQQQTQTQTETGDELPSSRADAVSRSLVLAATTATAGLHGYSPSSVKHQRKEQISAHQCRMACFDR